MTAPSKTRPLSPAMLAALRGASQYGQVTGNRRTLRALAAAGLVDEQHSNVRVRVAGTAGGTWHETRLATDYRINDKGRAAL